MKKIGLYELNRQHPVDALTGLKNLPDESVQCCVTSPPYWGLRVYDGAPDLIWGGDVDCEHVWGTVPPRRNRKATDVVNMQSKQATTQGTQHDLPTTNFCKLCGAWRGCLGLEPTPELYIEHMVTIFRELMRVLRKDGTLWLNLGDSYASGKGSCFNPGGGNGSLGKHRKEEGAHPLHRGNKGTLAQSGLKPKDLVGIPWRVALALQADGWWLRSDIIWHKPNPMPESVTDRPTKSHEYIFLMTKSARYFYDADAVREDFNYPDRIYNSDTSNHKTRELRKQGNRSTAGLHDGRTQYRDPAKGRNRRSVWTFPTQPNPLAHFATFPNELPRICIMAGTSEKGCCLECGTPWQRIVEKKGGLTGKGWTNHAADMQKGSSQCNRADGGDEHYKVTTIGWRPGCACEATVIGDSPPVPCVVLDPFSGTGTTGTVAIALGRHFIGFDVSAKYCEELAAAELEAAAVGLTVEELEQGQKTLF